MALLTTDLMLSESAGAPLNEQKTGLRAVCVCVCGGGGGDGGDTQRTKYKESLLQRNLLLGAARKRHDY